MKEAIAKDDALDNASNPAPSAPPTTSTSPAPSPADPTNREGFTKTAVGEYVDKVNDPRHRRWKVMVRLVPVEGFDQAKWIETPCWTDENGAFKMIITGNRPFANRPDGKSWTMGQVLSPTTRTLQTIWYVDAPERKIASRSSSKPPKKQR